MRRGDNSLRRNWAILAALEEKSDEHLDDDKDESAGHGEEDAATADEGASARPSRARKAPKRAGDDQGASAAKGLAKKSKKK